MIYFFFCQDKPGLAHVRAETRPLHLAYIKQYEASILAGGPTLTDDETGMNGSVLLIDLPNRAAAEDFAANDPYAKAGLFESVTIRPWKKVFPSA